jgi:hypothetical protein
MMAYAARYINSIFRGGDSSLDVLLTIFALRASDLSTDRG